jgi:hypothetical protein
MTDQANKRALLDRAVDRFWISQSDYTWMALTERLERDGITARELAA